MKQLHGCINLDLALDVLNNPSEYWSHDKAEADTFARQALPLWKSVMKEMQSRQSITVDDCLLIINTALGTISRKGLTDD